MKEEELDRLLRSRERRLPLAPFAEVERRLARGRLWPLVPAMAVVGAIVIGLIAGLALPDLRQRVAQQAASPSPATDAVVAQQTASPSPATDAVGVCARTRQRERFGGKPTMTNGRMNGKLLRQHCQLDDASESVLRQALTELGLSARAHDKILRVSRTIADLADRDDVRAEDVLEAIHYRRLDRQL